MIDPDMTCLPCLPKAGEGREEKMGSITMILWKLIEILLRSPGTWSRLAKWLGVSIESDYLPLHRSVLEVGLIMEKKKSTLGSSFQGKVGFRNIEKVNWQSTSGSPSFFLPCRVPLNPWFSLSHPGFLSFFN